MSDFNGITPETPFESYQDQLGDEGRELFNHLQAWVEDFNLVSDSKFQGKIALVPKAESYAMGKKAACFFTITGCHQVEIIYIKLVENRTIKNACIIRYDLWVWSGSRWKTDNMWFGELGQAQLRLLQMPVETRYNQDSEPGNNALMPEWMEDESWLKVQPPFRFMALPYDLRLMIAGFAMHKDEEYVDMWDEDYVDMWAPDDDADHYFSVMLHKSMVSLPKLRQLLLVNKELHKQIKSWVFATSTFSFQSFPRLARFIESLPAKSLPNINKIHVCAGDMDVLSFATPCTADAGFCDATVPHCFCRHLALNNWNYGAGYCVVDWAQYPEHYCRTWALGWKLPGDQGFLIDQPVSLDAHPVWRRSHGQNSCTALFKDTIKLRELTVEIRPSGYYKKFRDENGRAWLEASPTIQQSIYLEWLVKALHETIPSERFVFKCPNLSDAEIEHACSPQTTWKELYVPKGTARLPIHEARYNWRI